MSFFIETDEPPDKWCRPLEDGQTIDVIERTTNVKYGGIEARVSRYVAAPQLIDKRMVLVWVEVPTNQRGKR